MHNRDSGNADRLWAEALRNAVEAVAGLTAVDGATMISDRYEVLAFGTKIVRGEGALQVGNVIVTETIEGVRAEVVDPGQLGGTRHLSAAQFVYDQHNALALVPHRMAVSRFSRGLLAKTWSTHTELKVFCCSTYALNSGC